jgi:hypothetical protein
MSNSDNVDNSKFAVLAGAARTAAAQLKEQESAPQRTGTVLQQYFSKHHNVDDPRSVLGTEPSVGDGFSNAANGGLDVLQQLEQALPYSVRGAGDTWFVTSSQDNKPQEPVISQEVLQYTGGSQRVEDLLRIADNADAIGKSGVQMNHQEASAILAGAASVETVKMSNANEQAERAAEEQARARAQQNEALLAELERMRQAEEQSYSHRHPHSAADSVVANVVGGMAAASSLMHSSTNPIPGVAQAFAPTFNLFDPNNPQFRDALS